MLRVSATMPSASPISGRLGPDRRPVGLQNQSRLSAQSLGRPFRLLTRRPSAIRQPRRNCSLPREIRDITVSNRHSSACAISFVGKLLQIKKSKRRAIDFLERKEGLLHDVAIELIDDRGGNGLCV
jgi:hypothetical protein